MFKVKAQVTFIKYTKEYFRKASLDSTNIYGLERKDLTTEGLKLCETSDILIVKDGIDMKVLKSRY